MPKNLLTPSEAAILHKVSTRRFQVLLQQKRVIGATQLSNGRYVIDPDFTVTPDPRIKTPKS